MARFRPNANFGKLNPRQQRVVSQHVRGKKVSDLGADDLSMAQELIDLGAYRVFAYDQHPMGEGTPKIWPDFSHRSFSELAPHFTPDWCGAAAMLSWPINTLGRGETYALIQILRNCPKVMYLGKNTDGVCCGSDHLYHYLAFREVLDHVPDRQNTLVVYGEEREGRREVLPEEIAGMMNRAIVSYAESKQAADQANDELFEMRTGISRRR
jgi:hypothetical protein